MSKILMGALFGARVLCRWRITPETGRAMCSGVAAGHRCTLTRAEANVLSSSGRQQGKHRHLVHLLDLPYIRRPSMRRSLLNGAFFSGAQMTAIPQLSTSLAGRYDIEREIGRGGMATVYLARDVRHERRVALKVLNPELGAVLGTERFLAEIRVTANLQHPNLLPLFDSGEAGGLLFYVMPYVEGESLRARLERERQLPVDEAVRIATAVASALDYAHQHGVIHRDLKPENILLQAGQPVVADFGIALAVSNAGGQRVTQTGLSLGTPAYMSPEQATGDRVIDGRTDIYSLGAMLYEMLTGEPPHAAATAQAVIAKLMTEAPRPLTVLRHTVPAHVDAAVRRALEKLPADRFASARAFAEALEDGRVLPSGAVAAGGAAERRQQRTWRERLTDPVVLGLTALAAGLMVALLMPTQQSPRASSASPRPVITTLLSPPDVEFISEHGYAVSPDASQFAFIAGSPVAAMTVPFSTGALQDGRLYVQSLDNLAATPLQGTNGARFPFWSPDGKSIGFFAGGQLKVIDATGSGLRALCAAPAGRGGVWGRNGTILFTPLQNGGIFAVPSAGGPCTPVTVPARGEVGHLVLSVLPDERYFLFGATESRRLYLGNVQTKQVQLLSNDREHGMFVPPDHLLFRHMDNGLYAQRFDLSSLRLTGEPWRVFERYVWRDFRPGISASENGVLVTEVPQQGRGLTVFVTDRGELVDSMAYMGELRVSHDGRRVALSTQSVGVYDMTRRITTLLPSWPDTVRQGSLSMAWSPEDSLLAYSLDVEQYGVNLLDLRRGTSTTLVEPPNGRETLVAGWTPDGRQLVLIVFPGAGKAEYEIWLWSVAARTGRPLFAIDGRLAPIDARLSPDGRWLAHESDESGTREIYVRPFPEPGVAQRVSTNRGTRPRWRPDGSGIYYLAPDGAIMTADISAGGEVDTPRVALPARAGWTLGPYDPWRDGKGFVIATRQKSRPPVLAFVQNWPALRGAR